MVNYIIQFEKRGENLKVFFKESMGKEEKTVKEIYTKIHIKDIVAFFIGLSSNTIEDKDPKLEENFKEAYKKCQKLYKELKDRKFKDEKPQDEKKKGRNNVPQLSGKVQIKIKEKEKEDSSKEKIIE